MPEMGRRWGWKALENLTRVRSEMIAMIERIRELEAEIDRMMKVLGTKPVQGGGRHTRLQEIEAFNARLITERDEMQAAFTLLQTGALVIGRENERLRQAVPLAVCPYCGAELGTRAEAVAQALRQVKP